LIRRLAYFRGGGSRPSGARPSIGNELGAGMSSAMQTLQMMAGIENVRAQTGKLKAETDFTNTQEAIIGENQSALLRAQTNRETASAAQLQKSMEHLDAQIANLKEDLARKHLSRSDYLETQKAIAQLEALRVRFLQMDVPRGEAAERLNDTWYGRYVRPLLGDISGASSAVRNLVR